MVQVMPLPLGHTAIGLAAFETAHTSDTRSSRLVLFVFITVLANLPDVDILLGLIVDGNGAVFHRGPTHSLLFALLAGYLASRLWRLWPRIPRLNFGLCALLIFSHVAADLLLTAAPVSLLWPFEVYWTPGYSGWGSTIHLALFQSIQDFGIAAAMVGYLFVLRLIRGTGCGICVFAFAKKRIK